MSNTLPMENSKRRYEPERRCGAKTRSGGTCGLPAGHATDHAGFGRCKLHGGNSPTGRQFAYKLEALAELPTMGGEIEIEPTDALLACVRREAGRQAWLRTMVEVGDAGDVGDPTSRAAELARLETAATERLARFSAMALSAGVAERRIRMAERQAQALAHAFTTALDSSAMGSRMSAPDRAELVRLFARQLALLEAGAPDIEVTSQSR